MTSKLKQLLKNATFGTKLTLRNMIAGYKLSGVFLIIL